MTENGYNEVKGKKYRGRIRRVMLSRTAKFLNKDWQINQEHVHEALEENGVIINNSNPFCDSCGYIIHQKYYVNYWHPYWDHTGDKKSYHPECHYKKHGGDIIAFNY
jgi:hypothetical protein